MAEEKDAGGKGADKAEKKDEKKPGSNKGLFMGVVAGLIVLEVIIMYVVITVTRPKSPQEIAAAAAADSMKVTVEHTEEMGATTKPVEVLTNVAGTDGERFLKVMFVLEYHDPEAKKEKKGGGEGEGKSVSKTEEEIMKRMPKLKNMLIDLLATRSLTELNEPTTKEMLRKDFMRQINETMPNEPEVGKVSDVLFEQFIIQ